VLHHHHSPAAAVPFERLTATIQLANDFAHHLAGAEAANPAPTLGNPEALALLQITPDDVASQLDQTRQDLQRVQGLLDMKP
jgi:hypothetical protein